MSSCDQGWSADEEDGSDLAQECERASTTFAGEGRGFGKFGRGLAKFT